MSGRALLPLFAAFASCASVGHSQIAAGDGAEPIDAAADAPRVDLSVGDGAVDAARAIADLSAEIDQAAPLDLAVAVDGTKPLDLSVPDLAEQDLAKRGDAVFADLRPPSDLAKPLDLARPADLTTPPDLSPACIPATQPCDVLCQNCGQNLKCGSIMGKPTCIAAGNVPTGQSCGMQGVDDCVTGDVCVLLSSKLGRSECAEFCRTDGNCLNGGRCTITLSGGNLKVCSDPINACQPVPPQAGCNAGGCFVVDGMGDTGCHTAGPGGVCALCDTDYDCQAGFVCFGSSNLCPGSPGCLAMCDPARGGCSNPQICYSVMGWPGSLGVCDL